jgi:hypothetical protein
MLYALEQIAETPLSVAAGLKKGGVVLGSKVRLLEWMKLKTKLRSLSLPANYTDRGTAACRGS